TLEDAWIVAREISARAGGDPGFPGLGGPMAPPPPVRPGRLIMLGTDGWEVATADAREALAEAAERVRRAGVAVVSRHTDRAVADLEASLAGAGPRSRRINNWEGRWPLNVYRQRDAS